MQYGDLLGFLRKRRGLKDDFYQTQTDIKDSLTSKELLSFAADTARGMDFLATNKVCQFASVFGWEKLYSNASATLLFPPIASLFLLYKAEFNNGRFILKTNYPPGRTKST